jgi:hypothetical protein
LAQRALDRRLTEELIRFKANVSALTDELEAVKAHDYEVTKQAIQVNSPFLHWYSFPRILESFRQCVASVGSRYQDQQKFFSLPE